MRSCQFALGTTYNFVFCHGPHALIVVVTFFFKNHHAITANLSFSNFSVGTLGTKTV